ncbi:hypothetical protein IT570_13025 [Candidatus Sumerlaeota bacterium]|nr:hypothetical protein [Candidatus Sumerlaeota bacterium]
MIAAIPPRLRDFLLAAILFILGLFAFWEGLHYDFLNWDDRTYIHQNAWLLNLSTRNIAGVFTHSYFSNYHPLTMLSYMVDFHFFGYTSTGYHLVNMLLHAATAAVAFALLRALGGGRIVSFLLVAVFAQHPLRIESVVWISERKDVLCAFFYASSLLLWVLHGRARRWSVLLLVGAILCALLSLLSKAMAISLPVIFVLHDVLFRRRFDLQRAVACAFLLIVSVIIAYANHQAQDTALIVDSPLWERLKVAAWSPLHYAMKTIAPVKLCALYPYELRPTRDSSLALLGFAFSGALLAAAVAFWRRAPFITFAILAALVALGPVSGLIAFSSAYAADRYSYIPTLLLIAGLAPAMTPIINTPHRKRICLLAGFVLCCAAKVTSLSVVEHWKNSEALWARVLAIYPDSRKAQLNAFHAKATEGEQQGQVAADVVERNTLGEFTQTSELHVSALLKAGRLPDAMKAAEAIADKPTSLFWQARVVRRSRDVASARRIATELASQPTATSDQRAEVALALAAVGENAAARKLLEAIEEPTLSGAVAWGMIAQQATAAGERLSAAKHALEIFPAEFSALQTLVQVDPPDSLAHPTARALRRAVRHPAADPGTRVFAYANLGRLALKTDSIAAHDYYEKAFDVKFPDGVPAADQARTLAYAGFIAEEVKRDTYVATRMYIRALELDPANLDALQNLSILCIHAGKKHEALEILTKAHEYHPNDEDISANLKRLQEEMENLKQ